MLTDFMILIGGSAAHFIESCIASYESHYASIDHSSGAVSDDPNQPDTVIQGKECMNLIVLISEMYNFQVISCILVYDLIRSLLNGEKLNEVDVELLLKITRSAPNSLISRSFAHCISPFRFGPTVTPR